MSPQPQPSLSSQSEGWVAELPTASTWMLDPAYSKHNKSALTRTWLQAGGYLSMAAGPLSWWFQKVWSLASPGRPVENTGAWAPPLEGPAKKVHVGHLYFHPAPWVRQMIIIFPGAPVSVSSPGLVSSELLSTCLPLSTAFPERRK